MFNWNKEKDKLLKAQRGIGFEEIVEAIDTEILDAYDHPNQKNITLRLKMMDLNRVKAKSKELGIPYQTIIGALITSICGRKGEIGTIGII